MSCGPRKSTGKTTALTIEVTPNQKKDILAYYTNGAALALDLELSKNTNPLPDQFFLTTAGCNAPSAPLIRSMIMLIYSMINTIGLEENIKLNDVVTETAIYRLDASYNAGNFAFTFSSNCDAVSVVTVDKICPANGLFIKNYCVEKDQWGVYHDGGCGTFNQLIKANANACGYVPPRPAGELIKLECVDVNQWGVYTDGNYGTYRQLILEKSTDCGYVPPIPGGTLLSSECAGVDKIGTYADGNYGTYREAIQKNSTECGYVPPDPSGTLITTECVGNNKIGVYADGNYGTYRSTIQDNSPECGYVEPPAAGKEITRYCVEKDLWGVYTDGANGERRELIKTDSADCGYTAPPVAGTELGRYCEGANRYARIADGNGGSSNELIMENSPECGYVPANPTINLTNSHSTIRQGDTETLTANFYGFEPNKRYTVTWNTQCPAEFSGIATAIKTDYIQTDYNGDTTNALTLSLTDNGSKPRGTYDTWVECSSEYTVSNHVSRTFIGSTAPPAVQPPVTVDPTPPTTPTTPTPTPSSSNRVTPPTLTLSRLLDTVPYGGNQELTFAVSGGLPRTLYGYELVDTGYPYTIIRGGSMDTNNSGAGGDTKTIDAYSLKSGLRSYRFRSTYSDENNNLIDIYSNIVSWTNTAQQPSIFETMNIKAYTFDPTKTLDEMIENTWLACTFASGSQGIPGKGLVLLMPNVSSHPQIVKQDRGYEPMKWSTEIGAWYTDIFSTIPRDYTPRLLI